MRYRIERVYARPVERIISIYNDPKTTLYQVLGVSPSADMTTLKKVYRNAALDVHPDKNPHPDAKRAFDFLQEAFATLSNPLKREQYDNRISRKNSKFSWKKYSRRVYMLWNNFHSRLLLFIHRMKKGETKEELEDLLNVQERRTRGILLLEKLALQPSTNDQVQLIGEIYQDNLWTLAKLGFIIRMLLTPVWGV